MNLFRIIGRNRKSFPDWVLADPVYRLNDDEVQNALYNSFLEQYVWSRFKCQSDEYERRVSRDRFGYEKYTPIRVNGSVGCITYLSRLVTGEGKFLLFHWLGCLRLKERDVEVYEAVSSDGKFWTFLYFDSVHPGKSALIPAGLRSVGQCAGITGTDVPLANFPMGLRFMVIKITGPGYDLPVHPEICNLDESIFIPPKKHLEEKERILGKGLTNLLPKGTGYSKGF